MKWPIRTRLTVVYTGVVLAFAAFFEFGAYSSVRAAMYSIVDRELNSRISGIEDHLVRHIDKFPFPQMGAVLQSHPAFQPAFLAVHSGSGRTLFEGAAMAGIGPAHTRFSTVRGAKATVRLLSARSVIGGRPYDLLVATDLQLASAILSRLWLVMLLSILPVLILSAAVGYWMSGRALAPIQSIVTAARAIDFRRLNQRVPVPATGDEIERLAETFNSMLERIEVGFRRMRDFTANASHELRTPVAIIRAAAEVALLRTAASKAFYCETLERILRESERNSALLESMLELSRVDSRADGMEREAVELNRSLGDASGDMQPVALARGVSLAFAAAPLPLPVLANREQIRRLWLILLDNAIKYTPAGGSVTAHVVAGASRAIVRIADTGIGIAPEHQPLIFQRFYRTDKVRSRNLGGAGLGLAIAREIALQNDAEIQVASEAGKGSTFSVSFPALAASPTSAGPVGEEVLR